MKKFIKLNLLALSLILLGSIALKAQNIHESSNETNDLTELNEKITKVNFEIVSKVFPNPSSDYVNFQFYGEEDAVLHVRILNELGLLVQDKIIVSPVYDESYNLETTDLPVGAYTLIFSQGKNVKNQKLQIQK